MDWALVLFGFLIFAALPTFFDSHADDTAGAGDGTDSSGGGAGDAGAGGGADGGAGAGDGGTDGGDLIGGGDGGTDGGAGEGGGDLLGDQHEAGANGEADGEEATGEDVAPQEDGSEDVSDAGSEADAPLYPGLDLGEPIDSIESEAESEAQWVSADGDAAEVSDFTPGEDVLFVSVDAAAVGEDAAVDVVPSEDGSDSLVFVGQQLVAVVNGTQDMTAADVVVQTAALAA